MKNLTDRVLSIILAFTIVILCVSVRVFADASDDDSYHAIVNYYLEGVTAFANGTISYDEFTDVSARSIGRATALTTNKGMGIAASKYMDQLSYNIGYTVSKYGMSAPSVISDWLSSVIDGYSHSGQQSTTDRKGYGALMIQYLHNTKVVSSYTYCEYIVIYDTYNYYYYGDGYQYFPSLDQTSYFYYASSGSYGSVTAEPYDIELYGDIRYRDGTKAPTNDSYTDYTYYDFSNASDGELEDILRKLVSSIEQANPDLSNVEGLLRSIYYKLDSLDSDNDNGILSEINASILSLANNSNTDNTELIEVLGELKEAIKDRGTEGERADLSEVIKKMDDIKKSIDGLALIEVADNLLELTESEEQLFDAYADLVMLLVHKIGFATVSAVMHDIESVIFTSSPPSDFIVNIFGEEYAILTASMFTSEALKYLQLARTFISVILVYSWCMIMRKRLTGGEA